MKKLMDYIDTAFSDLPDNKQVYKFRRKLIESVTDRANELSHAGLTDENVIDDLIISEHSDIKAEYEQIEAEITAHKRKKNAVKLRIAGSLFYFIAVAVIFLALGFITKDWSKVWIFPVNGFLIYVAYMSISAVISLSSKRSLFHPISRILLAVSVFSFTFAIFLISLALFHRPHSWLIFIYGVLAFFIADGIYAEIATERFAIYFHLLYIVPSAAMLYIILSVHRVIHWHPGWIMIPASILIVVLVIIIRLIIHSKDNSEEMEDDSEWNED